MTFQGYIDIYAAFQLASDTDRDKAVEEIFMVFKNGFNELQQLDFLKMLSVEHLKKAVQVKTDEEQLQLMKLLTDYVKLRAFEDFDLAFELERRGYKVGIEKQDNTIKFDKDDGVQN